MAERKKYGDLTEEQKKSMQEAHERYVKKNDLVEVKIRMSKAKRAALQEYVNNLGTGISVTQFINAAIDTAMGVSSETNSES